MSSIATTQQQDMAESLGARLCEIVSTYVRPFAPSDVDDGTMTMNVACAMVQCSALASADLDGNRLNFVEGVGFAIGIMHAQYAEMGSAKIIEALHRGVKRGSLATANELQSKGVA